LTPELNPHPLPPQLLWWPFGYLKGSLRDIYIYIYIYIYVVRRLTVNGFRIKIVAYSFADTTCICALCLLVLTSCQATVLVFYVLLTMHPLYNLFQMKPSRCTLLLGIFISTSLHVSGDYVPIIRITYCIYSTLVFFTVYGWLSGLLQQTRQSPIKSEKYQCRIDTVSSPDDGHTVARNM